MLIVDKLTDAIACIKAHPEGRLATKYHKDGRCSWAYKWPGGGDAWRFQADDPHPANSRKLEGYHDLYRLRVGDWRIIYQVINDQLLILVLEVGSRGEVYRGY